MAHWINAVVLSALAVITLGFPRPDDRAYNIPSVGTGQRSQYYVGHNDGSFKYGYDTGDGAFESVKLKGDGQLDGQFGYTDPDGNDVRLEYESGTSGFVARGSHIPQPPAEVAQAIAAARTRTTPFVDHLASEDSDASFGFGFKDDVYSRTEEADEDGTVRGSYTYTDDDGVTRTYNYRAGSGIGFVIEGNDFVQTGNGESPASTRLTGSASTTTLSSASSSGTRSSSGFSGTRSSTSSSGTRGSTGFSGTRSSTSNSGYSGTRSSGASSVTHSASSGNKYNGATKHQTSAAFNSITVNRPSTNKITSTRSHQLSLPSRPIGAAVRATSYSSGGAIASNSKRPIPSRPIGAAVRVTSSSSGAGVVPSKDKRNDASYSYSYGTGQSSSQGATSLTHQSSPSVYRTSSSSNIHSTTASRPSTSFSSQNVRQNNIRPISTSSSITRTSSTNQNRPFEAANIRTTQGNDGSYSLNYQTSTHSRSESADSDNNVKGAFAYVAEDDQQNREIKYEAGSNTGFIAEGAHIPVGPEVPGAPSGQPTGAFARTQPKDFVDPLANSDSDSSFGFGFQDETYSRTEEADEDGTVTGSYSYTDEEGVTRTYRYRAGSGIGFVIEGTDFVRSDDGESPASTTLTGASSTNTFSSSKLSGSSNQQHSSTGSRFSTASSTGSSSKFSNRIPSSSITSTNTRTVSRPGQLSSSHASTSFAHHSSPSVHKTSTSSNRQSSTASRPLTSFTSQTGTGYRPTSASSSSVTRTSSLNQKIPFEAANIRSTQSLDGSYSLNYQTSSHSRSESADSDNNVKGEFAFVADDDQQNRGIKYEAGSSTGFIAEGAHIPVGPEVPGAPHGQPTGAFARTQPKDFVDPLADTASDSSFGFGFQDETYSRTEEADEDGTVTGSYSYTDEDGITRSYRYRAGKGIGFVIEGTDFVRSDDGESPASTTLTGASSTSSLSSTRLTGSSNQHRVSAGSRLSASNSGTSSHSSTSSSSFGNPSSVRGSSSGSSGSSTGSGLRQSTSFRPAATSASASVRGSTHSNSLKSSFTQTASDGNPAFTLHQYDQSNSPDKFGYVLKFD